MLDIISNIKSSIKDITIDYFKGKISIEKELKKKEIAFFMIKEEHLWSSTLYCYFFYDYIYYVCYYEPSSCYFNIKQYNKKGVKIEEGIYKEGFFLNRVLNPGKFSFYSYLYLLIPKNEEFIKELIKKITEKEHKMGRKYHIGLHIIHTLKRGYELVLNENKIFLKRSRIYLNDKILNNPIQYILKNIDKIKEKGIFVKEGLEKKAELLWYYQSSGKWV